MNKFFIGVKKSFRVSDDSEGFCVNNITMILASKKSRRQSKALFQL